MWAQRNAHRLYRLHDASYVPIGPLVEKLAPKTLISEASKMVEKPEPPGKVDFCGNGSLRSGPLLTNRLQVYEPGNISPIA